MSGGQTYTPGASPPAQACEAAAGCHPVVRAAASISAAGGWTPEAVAELKRLHKAGVKYGAIAKALGVSKNSISGKANRLGLDDRPSPVPAAAKPGGALSGEAWRVRANMLRSALEGRTLVEAAKLLGWSHDLAKRVSARFGIKAHPAVIHAARVRAAVLGNANRPPRQPYASHHHPNYAARNPRLTPAQQAQVDLMRKAWDGSNYRPRLPPIPEHEAERLIAEAIAAGRVTKCPPAAAAPINNGEGFGR
jgi:hypothetical protein